MDYNTPHDNLPPRRGTYSKHLEDYIARLEDHITLLLEAINFDELSAYEREQWAVRHEGLLLRLLFLLGKIEADETERYI